MILGKNIICGYWRLIINWVFKGMHQRQRNNRPSCLQEVKLNGPFTSFKSLLCGFCSLQCSCCHVYFYWFHSTDETEYTKTTEVHRQEHPSSQSRSLINFLQWEQILEVLMRGKFVRKKFSAFASIIWTLTLIIGRM